MSGQLDSRSAIVTGAARGQGEHIARALAAQRAQVVLVDLLDDLGEAVADSIGRAASYVHHDITDEAAWPAVVSRAEAAAPLRILVNNAAIFDQSFPRLLDTKLADYERVVRVNQVGTFLAMRAVAPTMGANGGGSIINTSSVTGLLGFTGTIAYSSTKWAIRGMTKVAALELAAIGVRVNSVHPGVIDSPMNDRMTEEQLRERGKGIPLQRVGTTDDVAQLVLFLASDQSSYCTGSEFVVDGGMTAGRPSPSSQ